MIPTMVFGLSLLAVAARYALRPEQRWVPLILGLGTVTLASGALGFVTGLMASFEYITGVPDGGRWVALVGVGESLTDVAFALLFIVLGALSVSVGTWRIAGTPDRA